MRCRDMMGLRVQGRGPKIIRIVENKIATGFTLFA